MANIKTAISVEKPLFEEVDALAQEMAVSRSRLFALAAREFIERRKSQKLLAAINAAYADGDDDPGEERVRARMRAMQRELVDDEW